MAKTEEHVTKDEAIAAVRQMGRMVASLYYHFAREMIAELGEEKATAIISRAVGAYGAERGADHKKKVVAAGFGDEPQDYVRLPDLPPFGWEAGQVADGENPTHVRITYCPFAAYWREKDFAAIGRLYCGVDQAKYQAFHSDSDLIQIKNVLLGDQYCEMICRRKSDGKG